MTDAFHLLYAFVSGDVVKYVGKTTQSLKQRMQGYRRPGPTQLTNRRVHEEIQELLVADQPVEIYILASEHPLQYGEFRINIAAGLEDDIIEKLKPPWNERL